MQRRTLLKTVGGIGTASAVGVGSLALSGGASASQEVNDIGTVGISSDDGTVEYVAYHGDSVVTWDGFDTPAESFSLSIDVTATDSDGNNLASETVHTAGPIDLSADWGNDEALSGPGTSGTIESAVGLDDSGEHDPETDWHIVGTDPDGYGLPSESIDASELEVEDGDTTKTFTLVMDTTYTWHDGSDNEIFSETFTAELTVDVTNEPKSAGATNGDGEDGAVGA